MSESWPEEVKTRALLACARHCCICHEFHGRDMELHHIVQRAKGGEWSFENAIPVCFKCHSEVGHYNDEHPKGTKYRPDELRGHRDRWYQIVAETGAGQLTGEDDDDERREKFEAWMKEYDMDRNSRTVGAVGAAMEAHRNAVRKWMDSHPNSGGIVDEGLFKSSLRSLYLTRCRDILSAAQALGLTLDEHGHWLLERMSRNVYRHYAESAAPRLYVQMKSMCPSLTYEEDRYDLFMHNMSCQIHHDLKVQLPSWMRSAVRDAKIGMIRPFFAD